MGRLERAKGFLLPAGLLLPAAWAVIAAVRSEPPRADFVFVNQGEVSSLDPARATGIPEGRILSALYEGLTSLHPETLALLPGCAERWEISPDGCTVTFHLRQNLRWSDGTPLTAVDYLGSWRRLLHPATASPYAYLLWEVEGARAFTAGDAPTSTAPLGLAAPDPCTFRVRLAHPSPCFLVKTAFYPLFPVKMAENDGAGPGRRVERVSNGPFRLVFRRLKDRIRLARNPYYWDASSVALRTVDALAVSSAMTALNLYLTDEVDWINNVPSMVLPYVKERPDFTLSPNLGTNFLRFNTTRPPLHDARVRRALCLAVDKARLIEYVLKAGQRPADSFVPPGIPGYTPPRIPAFDPVAARRLLGEAGFPGGAGFPEIDLLYSTDETNRAVCEVIALELRRNLGIRIHPTAQERKGYFVSQNSLAYWICYCSWLGDYLDPSTFLDVFRSTGGNNRTGWRNERYDRLLSEAEREGHPRRRNALLARAEKILLEEMPLAPLFFRTTTNMIKKGWTGYHDNLQDVHFLKYLRRRKP